MSKYIILLILFSGCYYADPYYGGSCNRGIYDNVDVPRIRLPIERRVDVYVVEPELRTVDVFGGIMGDQYPFGGYR